MNVLTDEERAALQLAATDPMNRKANDQINWEVWKALAVKGLIESPNHAIPTDAGFAALKR